MDSIDTALRAAPGTETSRELLDWLGELDDDRWRVLLPEIREIAKEAAPRAAGVMEPDDVLGDLAVLAFERWIPRYRDELAKGTAPSSLRAYLKLRIDRHVSELRRKQRRRRQLLANAMPVADVPEAQPILVGRTGEPFTDAVASELMRKAGNDKTLRAVLALKYAGFSQDEIAGYLDMSRPTVSRRVATIAAALTVLVAIGLTAWWFTRPEDAPIVTPDGEVMAARPNQGSMPEIEPPLPPPPPPREPSSLRPEHLAAEQIRRVVNANRTQVQRCYETETRRTGESPTLRTDVQVTIAANGEVAEASARGGELGNLQACIERVVSTWRFPAAVGTTTTSIPFIFSGVDSDFEPEASNPQNFEQQAIECSQRGDNQCVTRVLEGHARTPRALGLLIEAYRAQARHAMAVRHMRTFVNAWPNTPQGRNYQQILNVQDR